MAEETRSNDDQFAAALILLDGGRIHCEIDGDDDDFAESIELSIIAKDGHEMALATLPVAMDDCSFGDSDTHDYNLDRGLRSLGALFAAAPDLLRERDALLAEAIQLRARVEEMEREGDLDWGPDHELLI